MNKLCALPLVLITLIAHSCRKQDETGKLAEYIKEERRLRDKIPDGTVLEDSLMKAQKKLSIDIQEEFSRLYRNPKEWPVLLRKLKSG
jgi:hypothetical protein